MNRILVTGGSGFVGGPLLNALGVAEQTEIHALTWGIAKSPLSPLVTWHEANLLDPASIDLIFRDLRPDGLVHLAWCADHATYWTDPANLEWLAASLRVARAFATNGGARAVFAGTSAEYDWGTGLPLDEVATPLNPQRLYGSCKLACYWATKALFEQHGLSWAWARFFNPFGPHEDPRRLIPKVCLRLLAGEKQDFDAALSQRDFLHVDDVGSALATVALSEVQGPVNVGSGIPLRIRNVVSAIAKHLGKEDLVSFSAKNSDQNAVVADVARLRDEAGWSPSLTFEQRLAQTCVWWQSQGLENKH